MPMQKSTGKSALEAHKIFPYVAWVLTLGFVIFVYNITIDLKETTQELRQQTNALEDKVNVPIHEITDFESLR